LVSEAETRELLLEAAEEDEAAAEEAAAAEDDDDDEAAVAEEALELDAPPVEALVSSGRARLATGSSPLVSPSIAGCCGCCFWVLRLQVTSVAAVASGYCGCGKSVGGTRAQADKLTADLIFN
jgi:hypothetical protein